MTRFLAILKDSMRETIDGKVFLAMIVLSSLAILLAASLSFTPKPADTGLSAMTDEFEKIPLASFDRSYAIQYEISDFKQLNDARKPWNGEYSFRLTARDAKKFPFKLLVMFTGMRGSRRNPEQSHQDREEIIKIVTEAQGKPQEEQEKYIEEKLLQKMQRVKAEQLEEYIFDQYTDRGNLEVTSVKSAPTPADEKGLYAFDIKAKGKANTYNRWPHDVGIFFGAWDLYTEPVGVAVFDIEKWAVGYVGGAIFLLISSVMTAFFIPNMLRKGTVDLLLSKPIHRWSLLLLKYFGGLLFMFLNTVVLIGGFWLVMGLRSGIWGWTFLLMIPILTFQFAIYYAVSTLAGVLSRNTIVAILAACFTWAFLFVLGWMFTLSKPVPGRESSKFHKTVKVIHKITPRIGDLDSLSTYVIRADLLQEDNFQKEQSRKAVEDISWPESISVSLIFIALLLGAACAWFSTREY
jgi:ABC-type transport system involved in multi-copper enzyme maturation permease subunit